MSSEIQWPVNWRHWPHEAKINYLTLGKTRLELLEIIRDTVNTEGEGPRLTKEEIAAIQIALQNGNLTNK